jgi:hypothetical protein
MARSSGSDGSDSAGLPLPRQKSFDIDLEAMMNSLYSE